MMSTGISVCVQVGNVCAVNNVHIFERQESSLMRSTSVLSCLDERTACIYIISSDVCAFS